MKHGTVALTRDILHLHRGGLSVRAISHRVGVSPQSVWKRLARRGIRRRKNVLVRFDAGQLERAAALYRSGHGVLRVARFLGLKSGNAAARVLRVIGVEVRKNPYERRRTWTSSST